MKEITINTARTPIAGLVSGSLGDELVLGIHGWSQRNGRHTWAPLLDFLGEAGFYAVSVDMPGWGESPAWSSSPISTELALEALNAIITSLGYKRASLMGKSWGGAIALELALRTPEAVSSLILTAPAFREPLRLKTLQQPVLLAWSEDDPVIPYQYASAFIEVIPLVELVTYDSGGHSAGPKNAEHFAPKTVEFLTSHRGAE
ncbi:MAG: alpha/beta fold hydrolase [Candidatus Promineifilaceae bacterium]